MRGGHCSGVSSWPARRRRSRGRFRHGDDLVLECRAASSSRDTGTLAIDMASRRMTETILVRRVLMELYANLAVLNKILRTL